MKKILPVIFLIGALVIVFMKFPLWKIKTNNIVKVEYAEFTTDLDGSGVEGFIFHELDLDEGVNALKLFKRDSMRNVNFGATKDIWYLSGIELVYHYENGDVLRISDQLSHYSVSGTDYYGKRIWVSEKTSNFLYDMLSEFK